MQTRQRHVILAVVAIWTVGFLSGTARAKPNFGSGCAGCHGTPGGSLDVLPSNLIQIATSDTRQFTFDITDNPGQKGSIGLTGLDDSGLGATVGAGWTSWGGGSWYTTDSFTGTPSRVLDLTIDSGAIPGDYAVDLVFAGGPGVWSTTRNLTVQVTSPPVISLDEIGVQRGQQFYLDANANRAWDGVASGDDLFNFGTAGDVPIAGDWNGDGADEIGVKRGSRFYLDGNGDGAWNGVAGGDTLFSFGAIGDVAVVGDWNGDGTDEIGVRRAEQFFLDANGDGAWSGTLGGDVLFGFGAVSDVPIAGDWDGDGTDEVGVYRDYQFFLDVNGDRDWTGVAGGDDVFSFGTAGDAPLVGDWNNDGTDDVGTHRLDRFYLDANGDRAWNNVAGGDVFFKYGAVGDIALVGNWDGSTAALTATLVAIPEPSTGLLALLALCSLLSSVSTKSA
jgi:hypothetical protein